jgi:membrane-associated protein
MIADALDFILTLSGWPAYSIILALVFAEAALFIGFLLPGETALLFGGVLAAGDHLSLAVLIPAAVLAAVIGDSVGYEVGRRYGARILSSRLGGRISSEAWDRVESFAIRRGGWAVFAGRWTALLRALIPATAGATRMPYRTFLVFNLIGGTTWVVVVTSLGYTAGASVAHVTSVLGYVSLGMLGLITAAGVYIFHRRRRSAATAEIVSPEQSSGA